MAILQAYVDESEQSAANPPNGREPLRVLSYVGYIASSERWQAFSDEWQACLDASPSIEYLKMSEAMGFNGQFRGWKSPDRYAKIGALYEIMQRHIQGGACFVLNLNDFNMLRGHFPKPQRNKYFYASYGLMHNMTRFLEHLGLEGEVNFIFDHQTWIERKVHEAWASFRASGIIPKERLGTIPIFEDEKRFRPLQAADLGAWVIARRAILKYTGGEPNFPWEIDTGAYLMVGTGSGRREIVEHLARAGVSLEDVSSSMTPP
jgi:hypothetical protein